MGDKSRVVEIRATYWICKQHTESSLSTSSDNDGTQSPTKIQSFGTSSHGHPEGDESHVVIDTPLRVGLPVGMIAEKRQAGDESYSGIHDQGPMPPLREGGTMALLLQCAQQAKAFNDQYLTEVISTQSKLVTKPIHNKSGETENPIKKAKVDSTN